VDHRLQDLVQIAPRNFRAHGEGGGAFLAVGVAREPDDGALVRFVLRWGIAGEPATVLEARHPDGHPLRPLAWLANTLPQIPGGERGLIAGDVVTTGSYAGVLDVPAAVPLTFVFGELGRIDVELRPEPR
jgi:2-keto-4-pentenoate hydratase